MDYGKLVYQELAGGDWKEFIAKTGKKLCSMMINLTGAWDNAPSSVPPVKHAFYFDTGYGFLRYSVVPYIAELLDEFNTTVLMYSGDRDLAVSAQSTELSLEKMKWSGTGGWMDPDTTKWHQWTVDGQFAGHTKYFKGLTFLVVYNSGHFVPM